MKNKVPASYSENKNAGDPQLFAARDYMGVSSSGILLLYNDLKDLSTFHKFFQVWSLGKITKLFYASRDDVSNSWRDTTIPGVNVDRNHFDAP